VASGIVLAVALLLPLTQPRPWQWWEEGPPLPLLSGHVVDEADLLPPDEEEKLIARLRSLETRTGHYLIIVAVESLNEQSIEGFGLRLGRSWAVGRKDIDDDVLLIIAPNEHEVRIQAGRRLEKQLSDRECSRIIRELILPPFAKADFAKGVDNGVAAIIRRIS